MITDTDLHHLRRAVDLAHRAADLGNGPFGSVLVAADGTVLAEDHNREVASGDDRPAGDPTLHPEIELARWALTALDADARAATTLYTSGEHCPMCSAGHAWCGLGRIVYAGSSAQLTGWLAEIGAPASPVAPLPIRQVAPGVVVDGPAPQFEAELRALHQRAAG